MKKNFSDYLVAIVVIACSLTLLGALAWALNGRSQASARTVDIDFPDVTGIRVHSELRFAGANVGSISKIRLLSPAERAAMTGEQRANAIRITADLIQGVPPIPSDVQASIASDTLLSEKFIALSAGTPEAVPLASGALLQGRSGTSFDDLLGSVGPIMKSVEKTLAAIDPLLAKMSDTLDSVKGGVDETMPKISRLADSAQEAIGTAEDVLKHADRLISDNEGAVKDNLAELRLTLTQAQGLLKNANVFISDTDRQVGSRMRELAVVLQNLKVVTTQAKAITQAIGERPNRLIFGGKVRQLTTEADILRSTKPLPAFR